MPPPRAELKRTIRGLKTIVDSRGIDDDDREVVDAAREQLKEVLARWPKPASPVKTRSQRQRSKRRRR